MSIVNRPVILNYATHYVHLIPYRDCERRSTDAAPELLSVLRIFHHGLHQGIINRYSIR